MIGLRSPNRPAIEFAIKAGIATIISVGISRWIGLNSPYWAGISAVVASAGSLGASISASITRIVATVIALTLAVGVVLLPIDGLFIAGITVTVTLILMSSLKLDAGARLAAASTLLLTAVPQDDPLTTAIGRGLNVPLGCIVAVAVGSLLFPHRAVRELRNGLTEDLIGAFRLAADALDQWLDGDLDSNLTDRLTALLDDVKRRDATLIEASFEPGGLGQQSSTLSTGVEMTKRVSRVTRSLVIVAERGRDDSAQRLLESEFRGFCETLHHAVALITDDLWANPAQLAALIHSHLTPAIDRIETGFRQLRESRSTANYSDRDVEHLLHAMWCLHAFDEAFIDHSL